MNQKIKKNLKKKIHIINYGFGNITSVKNAIEFIGYDAVICKNSEEIKDATHLILPGVGSFESGIKSLKENNWFSSLQNFVDEGKYLFGICLGMQLLFEKGKNEKNNEDIDGLYFFEGRCEKFFNNLDTKLQLPHIGFNKVEIKKSKIWGNIKDESFFYFVHSYRVKDTLENYITGETTYGEKFISFIENKNVFGSQFHPEKSHKKGLTLLKNFCDL